MKSKWILRAVLGATLGFSLFSSAQSEFLYDQQSAIEGASGGFTFLIQARQPIGQSFTPQFDAVDFVRLSVGDPNLGNSLGATLIVNIRSGSITGPILGTSDPVVLADRFNGYPTFYFAEPVSVTPGVGYYLQPVVQAGDAWAVIGYNSYNYAGGVQYLDGAPVNFYDLWFREGVVVPEPSTVALALLGAGALAVARWRRR